MRYFFCTVFILLLLIPSLAGFMLDDEEKMRVAPPGFHITALDQKDYYSAWREYFNSRLNNLQALTFAKNWLDYHVFAMTDNEQVHVGRNGWLFASKSIEDSRKSACRHAERVNRLVQDLHAAARLLEASGKHLVFSVIPNKSTIYPEYLGAVPQDRSCGKSFYELMLEKMDIVDLKTFVRLDQHLEQAKSSDTRLYNKTDISISVHGAAHISRQILDAIFQKTDPPPNRHDLAKMLLEGPAPFVDQQTESQTHERRLTSALIYGGPEIALLTPSLARRFDRIDMIVSNSIPSANHHENPALYDVIIISIRESDLPDAGLDLDRLCAMLSIDAMADAQNKLPLNMISAQANIEMATSDGELFLQSLGSEGFVKFPALPGSSSDTLRVLKIPITSPRSEILSWKIENSVSHRGSRLLKPGKNDIYLPLPPGRSIRLNLNPGRYAGVFNMKDPLLLEYVHRSSQRESGTGGIVYQKIPQMKDASEPKASQTEQEPIPSDSSDDEKPLSLSLKEYQDGQVFQRRQGVADVFISGTYGGRPKAIEAQVQHYNSHEPVSAWTVIDNTPEAGIFMGILPEVPQGGWYRLVVRVKGHPETTVSGKSRWGIGILVACIGQSNMKEWFHSGNDLKSHSLLSLHREELWQQPGILRGNGAIAFGNRLIGKLGLPVGLLDYAVNGSGLCKEANWGKGYWADRSGNGIYQQFIQGVAAAGGALEYIIWMQGEADAARGSISENQYRKTLQTFITEQCRRDIVNGSAQPQLPFLIVGMPKRPVGYDEPHQAVRNALRSVAEHIPDCYLASTSMDLTNLGRQHLSAAAYTTLGLRTAQTVLFLLGEESYFRGPQVIGAFHAVPQNIDITLLHFGGSDFKPSSGISGWQVLDTDGKVSIADVVRLDPQTIRIRLARSLNGPATVRYLYGAMPDTSRPVLDNSAMELPLAAYEGFLR